MNILLIMADQFAAHALERSKDTDAHFRTPNLDRLAAASTMFTQAYTPFPLCVPARSAMVTGRYPHQLGIMSNAKGAPGSLPEPGHGPESLGHWFAAHGYDCAYAGKWHARAASAEEADGFTAIHPFGDQGLVESCHSWLGAREDRQDTKPFLLVASFDDPHTICEYARSQPMPYGDAQPTSTGAAPPLPANFPPSPYAPVALGVEQTRAANVYGASGFGPDHWRHYRGAYAELVERVDRRIGALLEGIDLSRTAVVFISDHGDGDASHGWNQKTALYQESIRVPYLLRVPGAAPQKVDTPVAAVLGLLPTLCEVAGIDTPVGLAVSSAVCCAALSRSSPSEASAPAPVVVQTTFTDGPQGGPVTTGRALIHDRYKYAVYNWGLHREQLHDVVADPGELRNLAVETASSAVLEEMRELLFQWAVEHQDVAFLKKLVLPHTATEHQREEIFSIPY
ncbi:sulfatase [Arthrobacter alpinus]|uniref:sulfatase family protein n=1 Tax=Arthrobacter alpinus TaxID=656366 RepID=UPI001644014D|nr:sulfatase-like hydrolase/transferase [Arthrobacter alpinus]